MTGFVFQEENVIFSGKNSGSPIVSGIFVLIVGREYGDGRGFGIGW
jgi:hypothetical protein